MPRDQYIFETAIYRIGPDQWSADAQRRVESVEQQLLAEPRADRAPTDEDRVRANMFARYAERPYEWRYNEVIAWARLLWDGPGPVVKAYLWQVGKKDLSGGSARRRYQRGFIPFPFVYGEPLAKAFEAWFDESHSDADISGALRAQLAGIVDRTGDLPHRYIDLSIFDALAPHIRWRNLIGLA